MSTTSKYVPPSQRKSCGNATPNAFKRNPTTSVVGRLSHSLHPELGSKAFCVMYPTLAVNETKVEEDDEVPVIKFTQCFHADSDNDNDNDDQDVQFKSDLLPEGWIQLQSVNNVISQTIDPISDGISSSMTAKELRDAQLVKDREPITFDQKDIAKMWRTANYIEWLRTDFENGSIESQEAQWRANRWAQVAPELNKIPFASDWVPMELDMNGNWHLKGEVTPVEIHL